MSATENTNQTNIQAKVIDFALLELVRQHRDSFEPLWTVDSWVKFLIWLALNCGLSGEKESLELFADSLGAPLTSRMRKSFFERNIENLSLHLKADPAELKVLVLPIASASLSFDLIEQALDQVDLLNRVENDKSLWEELDDLIAIPWR